MPGSFRARKPPAAAEARHRNGRDGPGTSRFLCSWRPDGPDRFRVHRKRTGGRRNRSGRERQRQTRRRRHAHRPHGRQPAFWRRSGREDISRTFCGCKRIESPRPAKNKKYTRPPRFRLSGARFLPASPRRHFPASPRSHSASRRAAFSPLAKRAAERDGRAGRRARHIRSSSREMTVGFLHDVA